MQENNKATTILTVDDCGRIADEVIELFARNGATYADAELICKCIRGHLLDHKIQSVMD